jgi:hypothetical protein
MTRTLSGFLLALTPASPPKLYATRIGTGKCPYGQGNFVFMGDFFFSFFLILLVTCCFFFLLF